MAVLEPDDSKPAYLGELHTKLPAGATFKQASEHMLTCQHIDTLTLLEVREVAKALSALYIGMQVTVSAMYRQDFFPTNIDGV